MKKSFVRWRFQNKYIHKECPFWRDGNIKKSPRYRSQVEILWAPHLFQHFMDDILFLICSKRDTGGHRQPYFTNLCAGMFVWTSKSRNNSCFLVTGKNVWSKFCSTHQSFNSAVTKWIPLPKNIIGPLYRYIECGTHVLMFKCGVCLRINEDIGRSCLVCQK